MILDSDNAHIHMARAVIDSAQMAVMAYASSAAAASAFSQAGIPILGPVLATAAAGMIFGLVKGYLATIPTYQFGGVVPGVNTNKDDVLIRANGGEHMYTNEQHDRMLELIESGSGGGGVHYHEHSILPRDSVEHMRNVRTVARMQRRLQALGMA